MHDVINTFVEMNPPTSPRRAPQMRHARTRRNLYEMVFNVKLSGNEVYYTA